MDRELEIPLVKDILIENVISFESDFTTLDAIKCFNKYKISTAPVVNDNMEVIGYLSESDCIKSLSNSLFYDEISYQTIDLIMSDQVAFAQNEWDIFELEIFFLEKYIRSAPIVDSNNHLRGIVTRRNLLLALEDWMEKRQKYKKEIKSSGDLTEREKVRKIVNLK